MSESIVRSRIDSHIKDKANKLFEHMGLTMSDAIRLFLYQAVAEKAIPFSINIPNPKTRAALKQAGNIKRLKTVTLKQLEKEWDK